MSTVVVQLTDKCPGHSVTLQCVFLLVSDHLIKSEHILSCADMYIRTLILCDQILENLRTIYTQETHKIITSSIDISC